MSNIVTGRQLQAVRILAGLTQKQLAKAVGVHEAPQNREISPMTQVFTLIGFVAKLKAIEHDMHDLGPAIVARACEMVANAAKEALDTYEFGWVSLKPEAIVRKMRPRYPPGARSSAADRSVDGSVRRVTLDVRFRGCSGSRIWGPSGLFLTRSGPLFRNRYASF